MTASKKDFSFSDHAAKFDSHIKSSIPEYAGLVRKCITLSRRFVQSGTTVADIGCSSGHLIAKVRRQNEASRQDVEYVGIDYEPDFGLHWERRRAKNLRYEVRDVRDYQFENISLAYSLFTVQFVRPADKMLLLKRIHDGLVAGGALVIAEKTLAESARLQDAITFPYYDYKRERGFSAESILNKEQSLRGQMTLWTETELLAVLRQVGFREISRFWGSYMFAGFLALK
jgi:tRNA (cmo5U34)-methyltransferase